VKHFRTCLPAGCIVEIDLPEAILALLQAGEKASVLMTVQTDQPMKTDVSLKGFSAALSASWHWSSANGSVDQQFSDAFQGQGSAGVFPPQYSMLVT
jgi:hypothetical protein